MRILTGLFLLTLVASSIAQTKKPAPKAGQPQIAKPATPVASASAITEAEVNSFLQHMFGFQTGATWKVLDIGPAEMPGVTRVLVQLGNQSQPIYVMPGGKFAMVGDVLPFGADPFAPVRTKLAADAHGPTSGDSNAPITMVEFSDLQCPHCKTAQPFIEKLVAEAPNAKLIYQPFPLPIHPWAMQAAEYAECVQENNQKAFWPFVDSVYESQAEITEANAKERFNGLASTAGADAAAVATCATRPETADKIKKSIELGISVGVNSTPTLFIEGRRVNGIGAESLPALKAMIDYEAKQKQK